jgi:3-hydroxyisobutyrate dehydrogenase-like beta-hydroxyacid dehydrogenase
MPVQTIAVLSPGEMGSAVGGALRKSGFDVITCVDGRSERTKGRARQAGFTLVPDLDSVVRNADLVLSILVPAEAERVAASVARSMQATGRRPVYADCNAISPATVVRIAETIKAAGGRFVDAGIIGGPPRDGYPPRVYASGDALAVLLELSGKGIEVVPVGPAPGDASAVKMCYGALTKGTTALQVALLVSAARLGVLEPLMTELRSSQPDSLKRIEAGIGRLPAVAHRWVGEMYEIASTFEEVGMPGAFHRGAAEVFTLVAESKLARDGQARPALAETVAALAAGPEAPSPVRTSR